ncbi:hypothetical protein GCM10028808_39860 [Spirosoma migulaei]
MYNTTVNTSTYTVLDVRKTFENCEADIRTIARRTGKWTMDYVDQIFHDVIILAEKEYLHSVDIALVDNATGKVLRASKFVVNSLGRATDSERAGKNNDWIDIANTRLTVILSYTPKWKALTTTQRANVQKDFQIPWSPSSINNSFPHLASSNAQLYASKGFELQKTNFK